MQDGSALADRVAAIRAFNRFYTRVIGLLHAGYLQTPYSVTEARVIYELAHCESLEISELRHLLELDAGYLSRILNRFAAEDLVAKARSGEDGRRRVIHLTDKGHATFAILNERSASDIGGLLAAVREEDQQRLITAMDVITDVLGESRRREAFVLRPPRPGDLGWVVQRHGAIYAEEYGWDQTFEALVARIVADYVDHLDPAREAAWIAEVDGQPVGSVLCVRKSDSEAQLRLLLVDPTARGLGIGGRLVEECIRFARQSRYSRILLLTNDVLVDARRIYERAGFRLVSEEPHQSFGHALVGQVLGRDL